jgi:hypothetical protein
MVGQTLAFNEGRQTMTRDFNRQSAIGNRKSAQSSIVNRQS